MVHSQNIKEKVVTDFKYESISKFWRGKEMNWHLEHQVFFTHEGERDSALSGVTLLRIQLFVTLMKITMIIIAMVTGNSAGWLPECRGVNSHVPPDFWNGRQRRFSWRQRRRPRSCLWSRCRSWRWSSRILFMSLPLSSQRMQQFKVQSSCSQYSCNYWFFNFQSGNNTKFIWFPSVFSKSYRAPVESTLCSRWVICGHISSNVEFSLHLGKTIKQSGRDMFVCKLMKKWISLACLPTWWLRPAQRCRRRPHTRPAPPQSCRRG